MAIISDEKYSLYYQRIGLIYQRPEVKASLEVILSVFTVTILIFAAIRPTVTNIATLQKKIDDQEVLNKKADNKITELFNAQTQLGTYQNDLTLFDMAVPDNFNSYSLAARLEYLAKENGVTVEAASLPGIRLFGTGKAAGDWATKITTKDATNILRSGVTFTISGNSKNVVKMVSEIENIDRLTVLKSVVFSKETGKSPGAEILKASGEIYFYFYQTGK